MAQLLGIYAPWEDLDDLGAALAAMVGLNRHYLSRGTPPLPMDGGVRYRREPLGRERWKTLPIVLALGYGDCEDLACAYAASYGGEPIARRVAPGLIHIVVRTPSGDIVDPSAMLGMGTP